MARIHPHLLFPGNAEAAFEFYRSVFGGQFERVMRMSDLPANPGSPISEKEARKILHIALPIGASGLLMGSDVGQPFENETLVTGNRYTLSLQAESSEEADRLFAGLSAGGIVEMPMTESPWNSYFGMFADRYGIQWMIDHDPRSKP